MDRPAAARHVTAAREVLLIVSVDTEEDNWSRARVGVSVENIRELRRLSSCLDRLGLRTTYFTTYQVAIQQWAVDILQEIRAGGGAELGAHLHPWNTPPLAEALLPRNSMLKNLPAQLQLAKLRQLTTALSDAFGVAPRAFRAGRFGLGSTTVSALRACRYQVDSSVTPYVSWETTDGGPTFVGAPLDAYGLGERGDVTIPEPGGPLVEIPLTCGYTRFSSAHWRTLHRLLQARPARLLHAAGFASRLGLARLAILSPETECVRDMLALSGGALEGGVRHLQLFLHSPSLCPGLSPWISTTADVNRLYASIEGYMAGLSRMASVRSVTMSEACMALGFGERVAAPAGLPAKEEAGVDMTSTGH